MTNNHFIYCYIRWLFNCKSNGTGNAFSGNGNIFIKLINSRF